MQLIVEVERYLTPIQWNGPTVTHKSFDCDLAFGPNTTNEEVYQQTVIAHDVGRIIIKTILIQIRPSDHLTCLIGRRWLYSRIWSN